MCRSSFATWRAGRGRKRPGNLAGPKAQSQAGWLGHGRCLPRRLPGAEWCCRARRWRWRYRGTRFRRRRWRRWWVQQFKAALLLAAGKAAAGAISAPVTALMEGVLRTMVLTKQKTTLVVFLVALLVRDFRSRARQRRSFAPSTNGRYSASVSFLPPQVVKRCPSIFFEANF